ncbi:MAG: LysR family transcriptional regulator [Pseudomonadota bacterium]
MKHWAEFRAAYLVGTLGTVSAASAAFGVHRATIIRYVDSLELALGEKLFHRHRQGYTPTEIGEEFLKSALDIERSYNELLGRIQNQAFRVSGEVSVCASGPLSPLVLRAAEIFQERFPDCSVRYTATEEFPGLELAEANIVLWGGEKPTADDYVIIPIVDFTNHLYASTDYIQQFGMPNNEYELFEHKIVCATRSARSEPTDWLTSFLADIGGQEPNIVFSSNCRTTVFRSIIDGFGIGILPDHIAQSTPDMVKVLPSLDLPSVSCWAVTHVDIHRTQKTQEFIRALKSVGAQVDEHADESEPMILV